MFYSEGFQMVNRADSRHRIVNQNENEVNLSIHTHHGSAGGTAPHPDAPTHEGDTVSMTREEYKRRCVGEGYLELLNRMVEEIRKQKAALPKSECFK